MQGDKEELRTVFGKECHALLIMTLARLKLPFYFKKQQSETVSLVTLQRLACTQLLKQD